MAQPTTREEFKDYLLRKLGAPVIEINVADEQVDDRVDEAVSFWRDYHYNGSQLVVVFWQKVRVTLKKLLIKTLQKKNLHQPWK